MSQPDFTVDVAQNQFLPEGGDDVNAIVTVTSPAVTSTDMASPGAASPTTGPAAPAGDAGIAEVIIIDCSGSMRYPQTKIAEARAATAGRLSGAVIVTIALTSRAPDGRYSFWKTSTLKSDWLIGCALS